MEAWMKDELVQSIPKEKLEFLSKMFESGNGKSQKELMRRMLPLMKEARDKGIRFSSQEAAAAIAAIRKHSSAEENMRIDEILKRAGNLSQ